jgi:hypothetical protein
MVKETEDRRINTDEKMHEDGIKRLPHERDESPEGADKVPHGIMKQAASDIEQGLVDTDLHGMRGLDQVNPVQGESGQAKPQPDANKSMREHDSTIDSRGKNQ